MDLRTNEGVVTRILLSNHGSAGISQATNIDIDSLSDKKYTLIDSRGHLSNRFIRPARILNCIYY